MRINICPKEGTPYFAMGGKCQERRDAFTKWISKYGIGLNYYGTDIVDFESDEDFTLFVMTWQHSYVIVE